MRDWEGYICELLTKVFERRSKVLYSFPVSGDLGIERVLGRLSASGALKPMRLNEGLAVIRSYFAERFVKGETDCIDSVLGDLLLIEQALEAEERASSVLPGINWRLKESYRLWQRGFGEGLSFASYLKEIPELPLSFHRISDKVLVDFRVNALETICGRYGFRVHPSLGGLRFPDARPHWISAQWKSFQRAERSYVGNGTHTWSLTYASESIAPSTFGSLSSVIAWVGYRCKLPFPISCIDAEVDNGTPRFQIAQTERGIQVSPWDGIPHPERYVLCTLP